MKQHTLFSHCGFYTLAVIWWLFPGTAAVKGQHFFWSQWVPVVLRRLTPTELHLIVAPFSNLELKEEEEAAEEDWIAERVSSFSCAGLASSKTTSSGSVVSKTLAWIDCLVDLICETTETIIPQMINVWIIPQPGQFIQNHAGCHKYYVLQPTTLGCTM